MGEPFHGPADADEQGLEGARLMLEERLAALEVHARAMIGQPQKVTRIAD